MGSAVVLFVGLGAMFAAISANDGAFGPGVTPISASLTGTFFAQLAIGVLGALMITGDPAGDDSILSGRRSQAAACAVGQARHRGRSVFTATLAASLAAFLVGQAILDGKGLGVSLSSPDALRSVMGAALYLAVAGMTGLAIGAILRNTAAAVTTFVAIFFVIPPLTNLLPKSWTDNFVQYLPSNAGSNLIAGDFGVAHPIGPWTGFALMCAFTAILVGVAAWRLQRADA